MQEKYIAKSGIKAIRVYVAFMIFMAAGTLFFLTILEGAIRDNNIAAMIVSGLMVAAGTWQTYRIYQNIKLRDGVLTIDAEKVIWELNGKREIALLSEVHQLSSWCGFTVLKNAKGKKLISFPENQTNINEIHERLANHLKKA